MKKLVLSAAAVVALSLAAQGASAQTWGYTYYQPQFYTYNGYLKGGTYADNIANIQARLASMGYYLGPQGINGVNNHWTKKAVKQFQRDVGIAVDGIVGPVTASHLNAHTPSYYTRYYPTYQPVRYNYNVTY